MSNPFKPGDRVRREPWEYEHQQNKGTIGTIKSIDGNYCYWKIDGHFYHPANKGHLTRYTKFTLLSNEVKEILSCKKCNTPNEYAEPNQPDNTYICFSCRN